VKPRTVLALLCGLGLLAGCNGSGRIDIAALDFQAIDPPEGPAPRFVGLDLDRCCWWADEDGRVHVALERDRPNLLAAEWRFRFQLSLALDQLPAGKARDYRVNRRELRGVARFGPAQSRFTSLYGIVALYREPQDRLRGSFRMEVSRETQQLLGGWSRPSRYLMMGTFVAVPDAAQGRRIAAEAEAPGAPGEPPASQVTSQPSAATRPAQ
jgi:hypothetical protein